MSRTRWHALGELVERWANIASQVERGYSLSFDDYLNDLDLRRLIDEQIREAEAARDGAIPHGIVIALASADDRFRQATVASEANVWGAENERDSGWSVGREWYYYRRPRQLPEARG